MKIRVGVFFGGKSVEHEISIISAIQAINCIDRCKYDVIPIYITKENEMYIGENIGNISFYQNIPKLLNNSQRVLLVNEKNKIAIVKYPARLFGKKLAYIDVALPIVHGANIEDGSLQGFFKMFNLPFVGCDVLASAVGMDKYVTKAILKDNGIPVLECKKFLRNEFLQNKESIIENIEATFKYPIVIKPINLGSSIGIALANTREEVSNAMETAFSYSLSILVEPAIKNLQEINCAVLGNASYAEASECEEPLNAEEILTYEDKYCKGAKQGSKGMASLSRRIPANISSETRLEVRKLAVKAFRVLGCSGVSRIDFLIDKDSKQIFLNEVNTIPGSLAFYLWEPLGINYTELLERLIMIALEKKRIDAELTYSFDTNVLSATSFNGSKGSKIK